VIAGEAVASHQPADAATQHQPGRARRAVDSDRDREPVNGGRLIQLSEGDAGLHLHQIGLRVDRHPSA